MKQDTDNAFPPEMLDKLLDSLHRARCRLEKAGCKGAPLSLAACLADPQYRAAADGIVRYMLARDTSRRHIRRFDYRQDEMQQELTDAALARFSSEGEIASGLLRVIHQENWGAPGFGSARFFGYARQAMHFSKSAHLRAGRAIERLGERNQTHAPHNPYVHNEETAFQEEAARLVTCMKEGAKQFTQSEQLVLAAFISLVQDPPWVKNSETGQREQFLIQPGPQQRQGFTEALTRRTNEIAARRYPSPIPLDLPQRAIAKSEHFVRKLLNSVRKHLREDDAHEHLRSHADDLIADRRRIMPHTRY